MSVNKLGITLFSSFLMLATAPFAPAQSTSQETTKKQTTTQKDTATKNTGKTTDKKVKIWWMTTRRPQDEPRARAFRDELDRYLWTKLTDLMRKGKGVRAKY